MKQIDTMRKPPASADSGPTRPNGSVAGVLLFADRLPPLIGGMEMHAGAFVAYFADHERFALLGVVTRGAAGCDCLVGSGGLTPMDLPQLPNNLDAPPAVVFFNSGRWIEQLPLLRSILPDALFVYRTGGNEIMKAPLERADVADHADRQRYWCDTLNANLDMLITNSAFTERRLVELGVKADLFVRCVGGVADVSAPRRQHEVSPAAPTFVCAARFVPYKNHDVLIGVFASLRDRGLDFQLQLAGDGPLLEQCVGLVSELGLNDRIAFLGRQSNLEVCGRIASSDYYIQLSSERVTEVEGGTYVHAEGMGRTILEALAHGTFVIATRAGALPEIIGKNSGLLLEPGTPTALARQLSILWQNPPARPDPTDIFSWNTYFARYEAAWEARLAHPSGH